ncbi:hypothetical protein TRAPUB_8311 [Trametes pubescens]|uniref:Uncharacterized protein n=1 Tax=Trametes pubescens TaxID=154538 RepID=A0A1M2W5J8_TRAPU|nr:hypothetical protein TRAPUB_8311 [Trametes pubescens]
MATPSHRRRRAARAALDTDLLDASARADLDAVRTALAHGADPNASDEATGHTAVTCAIAGDSWEDVDVSDASFALQSRVEVLRMLIGNDTMSLYALNAPARGVTPLALAAWLNIPDAIRVLLEESRGLVAVNGTDALGVTPLMYTARDGAVEAASLLLAKGARPDLRDTHHRTAIQHALKHPQMLGLCESSLRKQRAREFLNGNRRRLCDVPAPYVAQVESWTTTPLKSKTSFPPSDMTPSKTTASLIRAVHTGDVLGLYQHLYQSQHPTSILVNRLDSHGWSPLHYAVCTENLSIEILDALFLAGADTSLYTASHHGTPLHCLARKALDPVGDMQVSHLHAFVKHLVVDLRAPLSAQDDNGDTCIHVAAEHGQSLEVLLALLSCDSRGVIREIKNSRGLTALEVARPELRIAFGAEAEPKRSTSVASFRTVRPSTSSMSSTSSYGSLLAVPAPPRPPLDAVFRPESPLASIDPSMLPHHILDNLALVGYDYADSDVHELDGMRTLLDESIHLGELWIRSMQARIRDAAQELRDARGRFSQADVLLEDVTRELEGTFGVNFVERRDSLECSRRRTTDSGDSDSTAVSGRPSVQIGSRKWRSMTDLRSSSDSSRQRTSPPPLPYLHTKPIAEEDEPPSSPEKASVLNALFSPSSKDLVRKSSKGDLSHPANRTSSPFPSKKDVSSSGTKKLKAWFLKKLRFDIPDSVGEMKNSSQLDTPRASKAGSHSPSAANDELLFTARSLIKTAGRDLSSIEGCMDNNRKAALESAHLAQMHDNLDDPFMSAIASTLRSAGHDAVPFPLGRMRSGSRSGSEYSLGSTSPGSSVLSFSSTLIESEDDDTRVLRRLMTRKVEARADGAFEEIDKALMWLRIVQDTLRSLRRRTRAYTTSYDASP